VTAAWGSPDSAVSLAALVSDLAAAQDVPDPQQLERHALGATVEYLRTGRPFAAASDTLAEFRLRPDIASAAVRTPDVRPSERGPEWVTFTPTHLDRYALDRLTAWFEFAWRHAAD
jgi:hypothetical protein